MSTKPVQFLGMPIGWWVMVVVIVAPTVTFCTLTERRTTAIDLACHERGGIIVKARNGYQCIQAERLP